jgi:uncharacterized membrane protein YgaE (UPF0421/DUF939 family)
MGHYILGQGFLWSDLLCLTIGVGLAFVINLVFLKSYLLNKPL